MAELIIKIGDGIKFQDGDLIHAMNDRRISQVHCEHICHRKNQTKNKDGLFDRDTLAEDYYKNTSQYRFERQGDEVVRTDLTTLEQETFGKSHIDVELYLKRALRHDRHKIFGTKGNEVWYGGKSVATKEKLDLVWQAIEAKTPKRKATHTKFPWNENELKRFLVLPVEDFTQEEKAEFESSEIDTTDEENPVVIKARKNKVDWRMLLAGRGITEEDVLNKEVSIDLREQSPLQKNVIIRK